MDLNLLSRKLAFTLVELLVVTAIVAVLAAVMFPVFQSIENASRSTVCISNFRQVGAATMIYTADYDERFMPVSDAPGIGANSRTDHTWVQVVLPYTKNFSVFHCPADQTAVVDLSSFDQDLVPGDTYSEFYTASQHVNTGYNYQYLAPILLQNGQWTSLPRETTDVREPARTVLFVDSKWSLKDSEDTEGGSWLVVPPCRYVEGPRGTRVDTFLAGQQAQKAYVIDTSWVGKGEEEQFGGAWPWHMGHMTVAHVDGSVASMTPAQLAEGCDVTTHYKQRGLDTKHYVWDTN